MRFCLLCHNWIALLETLSDSFCLLGPSSLHQVFSGTQKWLWIWLHHRILWGLCRQHILKPATKMGYSWLSNIEIKKFTSGVTILNTNLVRDDTDCGSVCKCLYTSSICLSMRYFVNFLNNTIFEHTNRAQCVKWLNSYLSWMPTTPSSHMAFQLWAR